MYWPGWKRNRLEFSEGDKEFKLGRLEVIVKPQGKLFSKGEKEIRTREKCGLEM